MSSHLYGCLALLCLGSIALPSAAQSSNEQPFTLRRTVREVLTDVTVSDARGNPVSGIPASAFHIYDNGREQKLTSFADHSSGTSPEISVRGAGPHGTYDNYFLAHPLPVYNVLLIDVTTMQIVDQMYLYQQLDKFLASLPPSEPIAVYVGTGQVTIPMQGLTSDHVALWAAIRRAIPTIPAGGTSYYTDFETLQQVSEYLSQYPGRKNILWFTGGSNLFLTPDPVGLPSGYDLRPVYDALERERIALYPIDIRGLVPGIAHRLIQQQMLMNDEAEATGGRAYYSTNGLAHAASDIISKSGSFYSLTYSPNDTKLDASWHKVKVTVEGSKYRLSYR